MSPRTLCTTIFAAAALLIWGRAAAAQPVNDHCSDAAPISFGVTSGDNTGADDDGEMRCTTGLLPYPSRYSVWYRFTPRCSAHVRVDSSPDHIYTAVYPASAGCTPPASSLITSNCPSAAEFDAVAGTAYLIRVSDWRFIQGPFSLTISDTAITNSSPATASPVAENTIFSGSTCTASPDGTISCGQFSITPVAWFRYRPSRTGRVSITLYNANLAPLVCNDDDSTHCGPNAATSYLESDVTGGADYYFRISGYNGATGTYFFHITQLLPENARCDWATPISQGQLVAGDTSVSSATGTPISCGTAQSSPDVWYVYTPSETGRITLDTCGSAYDTVLGLYTGTCASLTQVGCNDDGPTGHCASNRFASYLEANVTAGTPYYIRVTGFNGASGTYLLRLGVLGCAGAPTLSLNQTVTGDTRTIVPSGVAPPACTQAPIGNDAWYRFTSTCTARVAFDTCGSSIDTVLAVYSGSCGALVQEACNNDRQNGSCSDRNSSYLEALVQAGQTYYIRLLGRAGSAGTYALRATPIAAPGQSCAQPMPLLLNQNNTGDTSCSLVTSSPACSNLPDSPALWYTYTPSCSTTLLLSTCGSGAADTVLSVFTGTCGNLVYVACNDDSDVCGNNSVHSFLSLRVTGGTPYLIRLGTFDPEGGPMVLNASTYVANGSCSTATFVPYSVGSTPFSTVCAPPGGPVSCESNPDSPAVWFSTVNVGCGGGVFAAEICDATGMDPVLTVYSGTCDQRHEVACSADNRFTAVCSSPHTASVIFPATPNAYFIRVSGHGTESGSGTLRFGCRARPCAADLNGDGAVNVADYLAFLSYYAAANAWADFNRDGQVNVADYLAFLRAYAAGCS
jgi:hypothetical protein